MSSNGSPISYNSMERNVLFFTRTGDYLINTIWIIATVINLSANMVICIAVKRNSNLHNAVNYLLVNLSIADILCALGVYPYIFMIDILNIAASNDDLTVACSLSDGAPVFFIASGASLLTLSTISLTRYLVIRFPLRPEFRLSKRGTKLYVVISWIASIAFLTPSTYTYEYSYTLGACVRQWGAINGTVYRLILLLFTSILPSGLLIFCYTAILTAKKTPLPGLTREVQQTRLQNMKKAENLVRLLMINYLLCWLPFFIYYGLATFMKHFQPTFEGQTLKLRWLRVSLFFATLNGTIDPFLYLRPNKDLKNEVKTVLRTVLPWTRTNVNQAAPPTIMTLNTPL